jgi:hypothetical protein
MVARMPLVLLVRMGSRPFTSEVAKRVNVLGDPEPLGVETAGPLKSSVNVICLPSVSLRERTRFPGVKEEPTDVAAEGMAAQSAAIATSVRRLRG